MIKKIAYTISLCVVITTFTQIPAFASNGLPKMSTPTLPALQTPKLSTDFNKELEDLKKEGFGQYKYDPKSELPLPEVEAPDGTGKNAFDKFKETYGDMWNDPSRQLPTPNAIPNDQFFAALKDFTAKNQKSLDSAKTEDKNVMANVLKKKLDTSNQWDLSSIKKEAPFLSENAQQSFLSGAPKPAGWGSVKSNASSIPSMDSWLSSTPKASGYGTGEVWDAVNVLDGIKGDFFTSAKKWKDDLTKASADRNTALESAKQKMLNGQALTNADKKQLNTAYTNELNTKLKPITSTIQSIKGLSSDWNTKEMLNVYNGYSDAEKKYGKGNAVLTGVFFGKPTFASKDSFVGKYVAGGNTSLPGYSIYNKNTNQYKYYSWKRNSDGVMAPIETDKATYYKENSIH